MQLTPAQQATIKADIIANPDLSAFPNTLDGNFEIAKLYNLQASPDYYVWKTNVALNEVGKAFNGTELAGLTTGNNSRLQTIAMYLQGGVNPSLPDNRQFFDDVFSGASGTITRPALNALWKRLAKRAEKVLVTGAGTSNSPSTLGFEGNVTVDDIKLARNS